MCSPRVSKHSSNLRSEEEARGLGDLTSNGLGGELIGVVGTELGLTASLGRSGSEGW